MLVQTRDGGTTRPPLSDSRCVSQSSGPQPSGDAAVLIALPVLGNAFALIDGATSVVFGGNERVGQPPTLPGVRVPPINPDAEGGALLILPDTAQ